jgi:hypothetical protein
LRIETGLSRKLNKAVANGRHESIMPPCPSVAVAALEEQPHEYFVAYDLPERSECKVRRKNQEYDENCRDKLLECPACYSG